jgi:hypothetical protein
MLSPNTKELMMTYLVMEIFKLISNTCHPVFLKLYKILLRAFRNRIICHIYIYIYHKNIPLEKYIKLSVLIWSLSLQVKSDN